MIHLHLLYPTIRYIYYYLSEQDCKPLLQYFSAILKYMFG